MSTKIFSVRPLQPTDRTIVTNMIKALYQSLDAPDDYVTDEKIDATFKQLSLQHESLQMEIFEINKTIVGYALLFSFWYNEYGGRVLNVDELFVMPEYRGKGIASEYLASLSERKSQYVALSLEVLPENKRAFEVYKRAGFEQKETITLHKLLR